MSEAKADRQTAILRIIRSQAVGTQAALVKALRAAGDRVDQSTLSRDLAELGIRKAGGRYVATSDGSVKSAEPEFSAAVTSFTTCGPHLIVIRTALGAAQPLAVKIDQASEASISATLAGDDTIFLATKSRRSQVVALRRLEHWFGDKHEH